MVRGEVLDGCFWIERCVQRSATLEVYRAVDTRDSTPLQVRVHVDLSSAGTERFERTCATLFAHPHPALERMVAWGKTERGARYAAIEVPAGPTLEEVLGEGLLNEDTARVTSRTLEALGHLHTLGLCHAALTAAAIVLPRGIFAGATLANVTLVPDSLIASEASYPSVQVESASHLAPERVRSSSGPTPAADIFALGCVVHRTLTGQVPFASTTVMGTYLRVLYEEPIGSESADGWGRVLAMLARGMMIKDPDQRPTARDALRALATESAGGRSFTEPVSLQVPAQGEPDPDDSPASDPPTRTRRGREVALVLCRSMLRSSSSLDSEGDLDQVQRLLDGVAGRLDRLSDGTLLVELGSEDAGAPGDPLVRAGRAALLLQTALPLASFAIARGSSPHSLDAAELLLGKVGRGKIGLAPDTVTRLERHFDVELTPDAALLWEREPHTHQLAPAAQPEAGVAPAPVAGTRRRSASPQPAEPEEVTLVENQLHTIELEAIHAAQLEPLPTIEMDLSSLARGMLPRPARPAEPIRPAPDPEAATRTFPVPRAPLDAEPAATDDALIGEDTISQRPDRKSAS